MAAYPRTDLKYPRFIALTGARTLKANESGAIVHNHGMTAGVVLTLPPIADGPWEFEVFQAAGYGITVTADTADTLITFNDAAADSVVFSTSSEIIAGFYRVFSNGTFAACVPVLASEAQTVTIAS